MTEYPGHGKPCNGCGKCCEGQHCFLGAWVFHGVDEMTYDDPIPGPCGAIVKRDDGTTGCGLMIQPDRYVPGLASVWGAPALAAAARYLNGSGEGCDAHTAESFDEAYSARRLAGYRQQRKTVENAMRIWGLTTYGPDLTSLKAVILEAVGEVERLAENRAP